MAIIGLSKHETTVWYSVRDAEKETPFTLGALTVDQRAKHLDSANQLRSGGNDGSVVLISKKYQAHLEAIRAGLKGWDNFRDYEGKPIPFATEDAVIDGKPCKIVATSTLNQLPMWLIAEMGDALLKENTLEEDKELVGNSSGA